MFSNEYILVLKHWKHLPNFRGNFNANQVLYNWLLKLTDLIGDFPELRYRITNANTTIFLWEILCIVFELIVFSFSYFRRECGFILSSVGIDTLILGMCGNYFYLYQHLLLYSMIQIRRINSLFRNSFIFRKNS